MLGIGVRFLKEIDRMGGSSFDLIAQELQKQHYIMEEMKAENRRLHQQLTDLRNGQGVFIEISGTRIDLETHIASTLATTSPQPADATPSATSRPPQDAKKSSEEQMPTADQANSKIEASIKAQKLVPDTANVSQPEVGKTRQPSTFLEEIMLDEFESALTAPTTIQPVQEQPSEASSEISKEEKQAVLRRELIGSFLLE
jgi:hypothetical protein